MNGDSELVPNPMLQSLRDASSVTEKELKAGVNLEALFRGTLTRLIATKFNIDPSLIWNYKLAELDESTRSDLKAKVKAAMASPQDTGAYQLVMEAGRDPTEARAARFVELEGLLVLGILGDVDTIPTLLERLREEPENRRMRTAAGAVLRHLTGQDIGGYVLSDEDLSVWRAWWERNKSAD
jgi:hypothetical protein